MLAEEPRKCATAWLFTTRKGMAKASVIIYFGFSGPPTDTNPKTSVTADFAASTVRV